MTSEFPHLNRCVVPVESPELAEYIVKAMSADKDPKGNSVRRLSTENNLIIAEFDTNDAKISRICLNSFFEQILFCQELAAKLNK